MYGKAIAHAGRLFEIGALHGHSMTLLDLGGGYPGSDAQMPYFKEVREKDLLVKEV